MSDDYLVQKLSDEYCAEHSDEVITASKHILEGLEHCEKALAKGVSPFEDPVVSRCSKDEYEIDYAYDCIAEVFVDLGEKCCSFFYHVDLRRGPRSDLVLSRLTEEVPDREYYGYDVDNGLMRIWATEIVGDFIPSKPYTPEDAKKLHEALQKVAKAYSNSSNQSPWDRLIKLFDVMAIAWVAFDILLPKRAEI